MIVNSLKIKRSLKEGDNAVDKTDSSFHSVFMRLTCSFLFLYNEDCCYFAQFFSVHVRHSV